MLDSRVMQIFFQHILEFVGTTYDSFVTVTLHFLSLSLSLSLSEVLGTLINTRCVSLTGDSFLLS